MSRVLAALEGHARARPQDVAVSGSSIRFSYAALAEQVERTAEALSALASDRPTGSAVAVMLDNSPAWVILDLALIRLGWPSLPIPAFFTETQREHAIRDAGAGLMIQCSTGEGDLIVAGVSLDVAPLSPSSVRLPAGTAKVTYTSGSTGKPKGVCLSLDQMEAVSGSLVEVIGADYAGLHLPLLPLSILLENIAGLYATVIAGGRYHVLSPAEVGLDNPFKPDLPRLAAAITESDANSLILVPELLRALTMVMVFTGARFPGLKLVAVGGAKVAPQLLERAAALGLPVYEGYGLSECASVVALNTPADRKAGTVGTPLPHLEVTVDKDREIVVGPRPFLGYASGELNSGPVRTGDLGCFDADGFLHIDGRRSNTIINAFGRNIAPEWVESELLAQSEIGQAMVFGEARAELGALIVPLTASLTHVDLEQAIARANQNLPDYAQVRHWQVREPFNAAAGELTGNGRLKRSVVLARCQSLIEALD